MNYDCEASRLYVKMKETRVSAFNVPSDFKLAYANQYVRAYESTKDRSIYLAYTAGHKIPAAIAAWGGWMQHGCKLSRKGLYIASGYIRK